MDARMQAIVDEVAAAVREARGARGDVARCPVTPAAAFAPVVRERASGVVFVHNHPSGDPTPSAEDEELTTCLRAAGRLLRVRVLDHLVVVRGGAHSVVPEAPPKRAAREDNS